MFWVILLIIIGVILFRFSSSLNDDKRDLQSKPLSEKFSLIVNLINEKAFKGDGSITVLSKRDFNLYKSGENQIVHFYYSTGHLTITWKYKYFQKEIIHEKQFNDVRNLSIFEQQKIAEEIIREMNEIIIAHKKNVMNISQIPANENLQNTVENKDENNTKTIVKKLSVDEIKEKIDFVAEEFKNIKIDKHFDIIKVSKVEVILYEIGSNEIFFFNTDRKILTICWKIQIAQKVETHESIIENFGTINVSEINNILKCFLTDIEKIKHKYNELLDNKHYNKILLLYLNKKAEHSFNYSEYDNCIKFCEDAFKIDSKNENAFLFRGLVYNEQKKFTESINDYTELININPLSIDAYVMRGYAYLNLIKSRPNMDNSELFIKHLADWKMREEIEKIQNNKEKN
jgi:tetratricopeptide (TPR) repeat protein